MNVSRNMKNPLVTVLMPVYNAAPYLREAIDSILNQTFSDFEFLIIDDGSSDNSVDIIKSYDDPRIVLHLNGDNIKLISTLNKGLDLANGKYIARMDADDISLPERIKNQFEFLEKNPEIGVLSTGFLSFSENSEMLSIYPFNHDDIVFGLLYQMQICHGASMFRKELIDKFGLRFIKEFPHAEDYHFFYVCSRYTQMANLQQVLYKVRLHDTRVSVENNQVQNAISDKVKMLQFKAMGYDITNEQLSLFASLNYHKYQKNIDFLMKVKELLSGLLIANNASSCFNKDKFREQLGNLWFNACTNLTGLGLKTYNIYWTSELSDYNKSGFNRIKLLLKSLLRK